MIVLDELKNVILVVFRSFARRCIPNSGSRDLDDRDFSSGHQGTRNSVSSMAMVHWLPACELQTTKGPDAG